jgi:hypothetical protein
MAPAKRPLRLLSEEWFGRNPYHLTHDAFLVNKGYFGRARSAACQEFYDYVRTRLRGADGNLLYPEETPLFCEKMRKATRQIRHPFGIVRANPKITSRNIGDAASSVWSEVKKYLASNPTARARHLNSARLSTQKYARTEFGQVYRMRYAAHQRDIREKNLGRINSAPPLIARPPQTLERRLWMDLWND